MSQAIANPEDLERFAQELKQFNGQLRDSMDRLEKFRPYGMPPEAWLDRAFDQVRTRLQEGT